MELLKDLGVTLVLGLGIYIFGDKKRRKTYLLIYSILFCFFFLLKVLSPDGLRSIGEPYVEDLISAKHQIKNNLIYGLLCLPILIIIFLLIFSKLKRINIFISYNHEKHEIVENIADRLRTKGLQVSYIHFGAVDPDLLIRKVKAWIKSADVVLVVPGNRKESNFTDAEVLSALMTDKMIILLKTKEEQHLPNTALSGLPVFELENLKLQDFLPLKNFMSIILFHFHYAWKACFFIFISIALIFLGSGLLVFIGSLLFGINGDVLSTCYFYMIIFTIFSFFNYARHIRKTSFAIRQSVEDKAFTKKDFIETFVEPLSIPTINNTKEKITNCLAENTLVRIY